MTRVAAIDCGTNSIRLLICDVNEEGKTRDISRVMEIIRLGEGVDATGEISQAALQRAEAALEKFVAMMKFEKVTAVRMVATSATRDATNKDEFFDMTKRLLADIAPGACAEVISGEEEATLSFMGAVSDLPAERGPFCVIDLGGGSTEFIVGTGDGDIRGAYSAQMGCVRITERFLHSDPPLEDEVAAARAFVHERLEEVKANVALGDATCVVGCAGTFTTMSALAQGLERYDTDAIHNSELRFAGVRQLAQNLVEESSAARALNPVIHPGRADVIGGGSIAVQGIIDLISQECPVESFVISEKDILDGIVASLLSPTTPH